MKKVLIKAPTRADRQIMLFPLLEKIRDELGSDTQINIMANENVPNLFDFSRVSCNFYHFPKVKDSMAGIHHYCYNMHDIFNIDLYLDFENSYKSAFMGFAFRAHRRIGIKTGMNKMFLTDQVAPAKGELYDSHYISFLEHYLDKKLSFAAKEEKEITENVIPIDGKKRVPIVIVMTRRDNKLWKDFFDSFIEQDFIIWNETNEDLAEDVKEWDDRNKYELISGLNYQKVKELFESNDIVVSDDFVYGTIANYLDSNAYIFTEGKLNNPFFEYMSKSPILVKLNNGVPIKVCSDQGIDSVREMSEFVDRLVERFGI